MRNIKNGSFAWTEKWAWKKIESLDFKKQASCKLIYTSLCISSSMQKNSSEIEVYKFDLARFSSLSEKTIQRYLPELENLGIIKVEPQDRKSNGKFEKCRIWLNEGIHTDGQIGDRSETDGRQMEDTMSDSNINITTEEKKKGRKEETEYIYNKNKFEEFWNSYDRKVEKKLAEEVWKRKRIDDNTSDEIIEAAKVCAKTIKKKFRKYPHRWLRDESWRNEDVNNCKFVDY